jgi:hypothetical protein
LGRVLLVICQPLKDPLCPVGQRTFHATEFGVLVIGDETVSCGHRQTVKSELEQWQASRLVLQIGHDPFGEARFELKSGAGRRFDYGKADPIGIQRSESEMDSTNDRAQHRLGQHLMEKVGPQGEHDPQSARWVCSRSNQRGGELVANSVIADQSEKLFELVDNDDQFTLEFLAGSFGDPEKTLAVVGR